MLFFVLLVTFVDYKEDVHKRHERHKMGSVIFFRGYEFAVIQTKPQKMDI